MVTLNVLGLSAASDVDEDEVEVGVAARPVGVDQLCLEVVAHLDAGGRRHLARRANTWR